jgi:hypothetical protein
MHVDHGFLLGLSYDGLIQKFPVCARLLANYRAIYFNRHSEASAFPHPLGREFLLEGEQIKALRCQSRWCRNEVSGACRFPGRPNTRP